MLGTDLRRGQITGDASRRWVHGNAVSYAYASATYAPIASPTFTGDPKAPTPAPGDNDTSLATTAFVHAAVAAGGGITQLTGDVTAGPGSGSQATTLATVMSSPGTYNNVTVNGKGQVTAASNVAYLTSSGISGLTTGQLAIAGSATTLTSSIAYGTTGNNTIVETGATGVLAAGVMPAHTGDVTSPAGSTVNTLATVLASPGTYNNVTVNGKGLATAGSNVAYITGNQTITLTGDIAGSGATAITATLPNINANVGTFQGLTVNAKGQITAAASILPVTVANGGTGVTSGTSGGVPYFSSVSAMASSALLGAGNVMVGGGVGATPATISNGQLPATATNDNAAVGKVGEYISSQIAFASRITIVSGTVTNLTTISLTAGDWDIGGSILFFPTATIAFSEVGINSTSATLPDQSVTMVTGANGGSGSSLAAVAPSYRVSIAATATIYLVGVVSLGSGTCTFCGLLWARRAR